MEDIIFGHITTGMGIAFLLGLGCLFLYTWKTGKDHRDGYSVHQYMRLTWPNVLFHVVASFAMLLLLHELGDKLIEKYIPTLDGNGTYEMTLSALIGLFGSIPVAFLLERKRKILNKKDGNIKHVHGPECGHDLTTNE